MYGKATLKDFTHTKCVAGAVARQHNADPKNPDRINAEITACTKTKTSDEWVELLNEAGVPCGPILKVDQVFANPQVQHLGIAQPVNSHERGASHLVGQPIIMSRTPSRIASPPPTAMYQVFRSAGSIAISAMRPDISAGPMPPASL